MPKTIKKISLYILIASLTWLPIQVAFASSFGMSSNTAKETTLTSSMLNVSVSKQSSQQLEKSSHCDTTQHEKDCCSQGGACSQMDHDCSHCVSFVAMAQDVQQNNHPQNFTIRTSYNHRLTGVTSFSAYRPPC